ncbi:hypothetical protein Tco_1273709 [Tanacetum coccineum]
MAQPQRQADAHQDELCPPNKRYALMDANKKIDLDNLLYPNGKHHSEPSTQIQHCCFFICAMDLLGAMLYCFVNNIHVDYAELLWEGLHYALEHPSTQIPYPRFTKLIVGHYITVFPEISRRARDKYHNLEDDVMVKNIFNSGKHKDGVGMKIPSWMITDEMKLTDHYRMYAMVFRVDIPTTQSQPIESTQGTHRTLSA